MEDGTTPKTFSLMELASEAGLPPRTVRYYFARHLLPEPRQRGRDAYYDAEHLAVLRRIRDLAFAGKTLAEIGEILHPAASVPFPVESWKLIRVADGVAFQIRADVTPSWLLQTLEDGVVLLVRGDVPQDEIRALIQTMKQRSRP
jgi:hypothetical protein